MSLDLLASFLPHKVGDDIYFAKTRKVTKSAVGVYLCKELVSDIPNLQPGSVVRMRAKLIESGQILTLSGVLKDNSHRSDNLIWPMYAELLKSSGIPSGVRMYISLQSVDIKDWFESDEEAGIVCNPISGGDGFDA